MKSLERQVDGTHYKTEGIEPAEFILSNDLGFAEGNAIKYVARHKEKGGVNDLLKAKHYVDMILEAEYGCDPAGNEYEDEEYDKKHQMMYESLHEIMLETNAPPDWDKPCAITKQEIDEMKGYFDINESEKERTRSKKWVDTFDDLLMMQLSEMPSVIDLFDAMVVTHDDCSEKEKHNEGCSAIWDQKLFGECKKD